MAKKISASWQNKNVIILGDIMLDEYIQTEVTRISPEGFFPILNQKNTSDSLGGAANVALNLKSLGLSPILIGLISNDHSGKRIKNLLKENNISNDFLIYDESRPTTTKTRFISDNNQIFRLDKEKKHDIEKNIEDLIIQNIQKRIAEQHISAIIFQDYNKGILTPHIINNVIQIANEKCILTLVDPKDNNFFSYKNVSLFKPNLKEIRAKTKQGINPKNQQDLIQADKTLREKTEHRITMITLSENGIYISDKSQNLISSPQRRNIVDVCGAGDTVLSIATAALIAKMDIKELARLCNIGGGQVCCKKGVQIIILEELLAEFNQKIEA